MSEELSIHDRIRLSAEVNSEETHSHFSEYLKLTGTLRKSIDVLVHGLTSGPIEFSEKNYELAATYLALFVRTIGLRQMLITDGFYSEAAALMKQAMEAVAGSEECLKGTREDSKNPNVKNLWFGAGTLFGHINNAAHMGKISSIIEHLSIEDRSVANITPVYMHEKAENYLCLHAVLITQTLALLCFLTGNSGALSTDEVKEHLKLVDESFRTITHLQAQS